MLSGAVPQITRKISCYRTMSSKHYHDNFTEGNTTTCGLDAIIQLLTVNRPDKWLKTNSYTVDMEENNRGVRTIFSDFILPLFSIITYLMDVGSDIWLAATYAQAGHWWWFGWTITFVVITGLVMAAVGWLHLNDDKENNPLYIANPVLRVFVTILVMFSLTSPVLGWVYYQPLKGFFAHFVRIKEFWIYCGPSFLYKNERLFQYRGVKGFIFDVKI